MSYKAIKGEVERERERERERETERERGGKWLFLGRGGRGLTEQA